MKQHEKRGDYNLTKALSPALFVVREQLESGTKATVDIESKYERVLNLDVTLVEEELLVKKFLDEEGEGGAPTNNTSGVAGVKSGDGPVIHQQDIKKFRKMARRSMPGLTDFMSKTPGSK
jgi:hypothetical protein